MLDEDLSISDICLTWLRKVHSSLIFFNLSADQVLLLLKSKNDFKLLSVEKNFLCHW